MIITKLHIDGFGKFHNFDFVPAAGVNVITGLNEAGKTTLHLFIRSMLYGVSTRRKAGKKPVSERMRPWQQPEIYGGFLEVEADGTAYRIIRDFNRSETDLQIYRLTAPDENGVREAEEALAAPEAVLNGLLKDLSETAYVNTVSAGQLSAATEKDMAGEIRRYAENVSTTVDPNMNADRALRQLEEKKQELIAAIDPDTVKEYNTVLSRIRELERELADPSRSNRIPELLSANEEVRRVSDETTGKIAENEQLIRTLQEELTRRGFADSTEIERVEAKARKAYGDYCRDRKKHPKCLLIGCIALIPGLLGAISCIYDVFGLLAKLRLDSIAVLLVSAVLAVIGLVFVFRANKLSRSIERAGNFLKTLMKKHIVADGGPAVKFGSGFAAPAPESEDAKAEPEITDNTMEALYASFDESRLTRDLYLTANGQRDTMIAELKALSDAQGRNFSELEQQQTIRSGVEADRTELHTMRDRAAALEREIGQQRQIRDEIEAVELAMETLSQLAESIRGAVGTYVNKEAARMLKGLTGGAYDSLNAGSGYEIELNAANGMVPVGDLSQGTADQVHMALRLSAIRFIVGDSDAIPLILDDSFALYDDERLLHAVRFLAENYRGQILIFTCQQREEDLLTKAGVPHNSIAL